MGSSLDLKTKSSGLDFAYRSMPFWYCMLSKSKDIYRRVIVEGNKVLFYFPAVCQSNVYRKDNELV